MELVQEVSETSGEVVEQISENSFKRWYQKLPVKPIDILNIFLLMGYLQSWFMADLATKWGLNWDIFLIQNMISTMMVVVSAHYFASNNIEKRKYNWLLFILVGYMVLSNLWSYMPNRGGTWELGIFLMYSVYLKNKYDTKYFIKLFNLSLILVCLFSYWKIIVLNQGLYPDRGNIVWSGIFGHKNSLGMAMTVGICLNLCLLIFYNNKLWKKTFLVGVLLLELYMLVKTNSTTSYLATVAIAFVIIKQRFFPIKYYWLYILGVFFVGLYIVFFHWTVGDIVAQITGKSPTFTGRTVIWDIAKPYFLENSILGFGYNGFWSQQEILDQVYTALNEPLTETHNSIFDVMLQFGIIGLILFFTSILKFSRTIISKKEDFIMFIAVLCLLFIGIGESIPISFNTNYLILFFFCIL